MSDFDPAPGSNDLAKTVMNTIPKLTGHDNYILCCDQMFAAFGYYRVKKILTDDWPVSAEVFGNTATEINT